MVVIPSYCLTFFLCPQLSITGRYKAVSIVVPAHLVLPCVYELMSIYVYASVSVGFGRNKDMIAFIPNHCPSLVRGQAGAYKEIYLMQWWGRGDLSSRKKI